MGFMMTRSNKTLDRGSGTRRTLAVRAKISANSVLREPLSLGERVYRQLRHDIIRGIFQQGEAINEKVLANRYQGSRTPVREAAMRLQQEGLLRIVPNKGYFVSHLTIHELNEMYEYRAELEGFCADLAARRWSDQSLLDKLASLAHTKYRTSDPPSYEHFIEADTEFHVGIARLGHNRLMVRAVADSIFIPFTVGGGLRTIEDIQAILRAGADKVSLNTSAIENPDLIADAARCFGSQCIVVAVDARRVKPWDPDNPRWEVTTHGGRQTRSREAVSWAREAAERGGHRRGSFRHELGRNLAHDVVGAHRFVDVGDRLHGHEIDDADELVFAADRELDRHRIALQLGLDLLERADEVRADPVHLVDEADARHAVLVGLPPDRLGLRLDPAARA